MTQASKHVISTAKQWLDEQQAIRERIVREDRYLLLPELKQRTKEWPAPEQICNTPEEAAVLFEASIPLAVHSCHALERWAVRQMPHQDYYQIVYLCLWGACLTYQKDRASTSTWIYAVVPHRCKVEIDRAIRAERLPIEADTDATTVSHTDSGIAAVDRSIFVRSLLSELTQEFAPQHLARFIACVIQGVGRRHRATIENVHPSSIDFSVQIVTRFLRLKYRIS